MKLQFLEKPTYKIHNDKVTECHLPYQFDITLLQDPKLNNSLNWFASEILLHNNVHPSLKGMAVAKTILKGDDVFNETTGKRIAETKAKLKAYKKAHKAYLEVRRNLLEAVINAGIAVEKLEMFIETEERHLKSLSDEVCD